MIKQFIVYLYNLALKKNFKKEIENWTKENEPLGKKLGYPKCCVKAFCELPPELLDFRNAIKLPVSEIEKLRYTVACIDGKFTGFIPCAKCAKKILKGKINLFSLIDESKRTKDFPLFPLAFNEGFTI